LARVSLEILWCAVGHSPSHSTAKKGQVDECETPALGEVADVVDGEGGGRKLTAANAEVETTHEPLISSVYA
jgi:hypothetical protein